MPSNMWYEKGLYRYPRQRYGSDISQRGVWGVYTWAQYDIFKKYDTILISEIDSADLQDVQDVAAEDKKELKLNLNIDVDGVEKTKTINIPLA